MSADATINRLRSERDKLRSKVEDFTGLGGSGRYQGKNLADLDRIEATLKESLASVAQAKTSLVQSRLSEAEEKRVCVVCQTDAKTVLLMPCRHMCLCKNCSSRSEMTKCPLCRVAITERIDVYA